MQPCRRCAAGTAVCQKVYGKRPCLRGEWHVNKRPRRNPSDIPSPAPRSLGLLPEGGFAPPVKSGHFFCAGTRLSKKTAIAFNKRRRRAHTLHSIDGLHPI